MELLKIIKSCLTFCALGYVMNDVEESLSSKESSPRCAEESSRLGPYRSSEVNPEEEQRFKGLKFYAGIEDDLEDAYSAEFMGFYDIAIELFEDLDHAELIGDAAMKIGNGGHVFNACKRLGRYGRAARVADKLADASNNLLQKHIWLGLARRMYEQEGLLHYAGGVAEDMKDLPAAMKLYERADEYVAAADIAHELALPEEEAKLLRKELGCELDEDTQ